MLNLLQDSVHPFYQTPAWKNAYQHPQVAKILMDAVYDPDAIFRELCLHSWNDLHFKQAPRSLKGRDPNGISPVPFAPWIDPDRAIERLYFYIFDMANIVDIFSSPKAFRLRHQGVEFRGQTYPDAGQNPFLLLRKLSKTSAPAPRFWRYLDPIPSRTHHERLTRYQALDPADQAFIEIAHSVL